MIIPRGQANIASVISEIGLMKMCQDEECILNCHDVYQDGRKYFMIVELMQYALNDIIDLLKGKMNEKACKYIIAKTL